MFIRVFTINILLITATITFSHKLALNEGLIKSVERCKVNVICMTIDD